MESCTAFAGDAWIASGTAESVRDAIRKFEAEGRTEPVLVFDDATGRQIDLDMRVDQPARSRGRPKMGVVAGEVTLLPRHWEWLRDQPGGASATLRRLVDAARRQVVDGAAARDTAYHFLSAMAGNRAGYEEAIRALYAQDAVRFTDLTEGWPADIRDHGRDLAAAWFSTEGQTAAGLVPRRDLRPLRFNGESA